MPKEKHYTEAERAPLTPDENARIREIIAEEEFQRRFWTAVRIWIAWIGGVAAAAYTFRDGIAGFFRGIVK